MLMNFSTKRRGGGCGGGGLAGRVGHRAGRINDSIFVLGGTNEEGNFANEVHRINCENGRTDTLILDSTLSLTDFALFSHDSTLFLWGGAAFPHLYNHLLLFDGARFTPQPQLGPTPSPRSHPATATFAHKYLILYGGNDNAAFLTDWHLLDLQTRRWTPLAPSLPLPPSLHASMVWLSGRGVLMLANAYDPARKTLTPNLFFTFYVADFNLGRLCIEPLPLDAPPLLHDYVFTNLMVADQHSLLVMGGQRAKDDEPHGHAFMIQVESGKTERMKLRHREKTHFESVFHKNKLFLIGGVTKDYHLEDNLEVLEFNVERMHFKRHVCASCRLYYDEEWVRSSQEAFPLSRFRDDHDYNYHLSMDNRVLAHLAHYIPSPFHALTLILQSLSTLSATSIILALNPPYNPYPHTLPNSLLPQHSSTLRIGCVLQTSKPSSILSQLLQLKPPKKQPTPSRPLQQTILQLKLASLRISKSCLLTLKTGKDETTILYYSCDQLETPHTNFLPCPTYHYTYNSKTKEPNSPLARHIVHQNVKHLLPREDYEDISNLDIVMHCVCGEELQAELTLHETSGEVETAESWIGGSMKEEHRKAAIPTIQLAFLPAPTLPTIYLDQHHLTFFNIYEMLLTDCQNGSISALSLPHDPTLCKLTLYHSSPQYRFKKVLVYHSGRLMRELQKTGSVCGIIELSAGVELDLAGSAPASPTHELLLRGLLLDIRSLKRLRNV